MKIVAQAAPVLKESEVETVLLSPEQIVFLARLSRNFNPDMPMAFGGPHVVRTLLERFETSGIDLTEATNEEELARIAAAGLRRRQSSR